MVTSPVLWPWAPDGAPRPHGSAGAAAGEEPVHGPRRGPQPGGCLVPGERPAPVSGECCPASRHLGRAVGVHDLPQGGALAWFLVGTMGSPVLSPPALPMQELRVLGVISSTGALASVGTKAKVPVFGLSGPNELRPSSAWLLFPVWTSSLWSGGCNSRAQWGCRGARPGRQLPGHRGLRVPSAAPYTPSSGRGDTGASLLGSLWFPWWQDGSEGLTEM